MPGLLECFSGTKSLGKVCEAAGWEVTRIDNVAKFKPTLLMDIKDFDETQYTQDHFDWVHLSPPCTFYSRARTTGPPANLEEADELVRISLRIINYFASGGARCTLENPDALMKTRPIMHEHNHRMKTLDYC